MTEPPPRANFSATANQMEIYDCYVEDLAKQVGMDYIRTYVGVSMCALGHTDIHTYVHIYPSLCWMSATYLRYIRISYMYAYTVCTYAFSKEPH